jgi:chaperonin GroEL
MTVAAAFSSDGAKSVALDIVRQAALETGRRAGDGTTTASTLACNLWLALMDLDEQKRHKCIEVLRGMVESGSFDRALGECTIPVSTKDDLKSVTMVASNGDEALSDIVTEAFIEAGAGGAVTVEEDRTTTGVNLKWINGTTFPSGFASPYFVTDGRARADLDKPLVWFSLTPLHKTEDVVPAMKYAREQGRSLLVICDDINEEALSLMIVNNSKGALSCCAVGAPFLGNMRVAAMQDLAKVCGATPTAKGMSAEQIISSFGSAERAVVEPKLTALFSPQSKDPGAVTEVISMLAHAIRDSKDDHEKSLLMKRMACVSGKAAIIKIGGSTPAELVERKDRADDAVASARWALMEGIMPGCGSSLSYLYNGLLKSSFYEDSLTPLRESFLAPIMKTFDNAKHSLSITEDEFRNVLLNWSPGVTSDSGTKGGRGYNLRTGNLVDDLIKDGVVDSSYAVREAVKAAVSAACNLASMEAIIFTKVTEQEMMA